MQHLQEEPEAQTVSLWGGASPFSFGEFAVYEGRTSYTLMSASISKLFSGTSDRRGRCLLWFYFLDFARYYAREANDETELLKLLSDIARTDNMYIYQIG